MPPKTPEGVIKRTELYQLAIGYNEKYKIHTFLHKNKRPTKQSLLDELAKRNYIPVKEKGKWILKPIKDPKRYSKIQMAKLI